MSILTLERVALIISLLTNFLLVIFAAVAIEFSSRPIVIVEDVYYDNHQLVVKLKNVGNSVANMKYNFKNTEYIKATSGLKPTDSTSTVMHTDRLYPGETRNYPWPTVNDSLLLEKPLSDFLFTVNCKYKSVLPSWTFVVSDYHDIWHFIFDRKRNKWVTLQQPNASIQYGID